MDIPLGTRDKEIPQTLLIFLRSFLLLLVRMGFLRDNKDTRYFPLLWCHWCGLLLLIFCF